MIKNTGIVRKVDELGRIVLPVETRKVLGIGEKDPLEIHLEGETIVVSPYRPGCVFCGAMDGLVELRGQRICRGCIHDFSQDFGDRKD